MDQLEMGRHQRAASAIAGSLLLYFVARKHRKEAVLLLGGGYLLYRAVTGHCPVSNILRGGHAADHPRNINVRTHVTVNKPRQEVYAYWRRLENLPLFMRHLESVDEIDQIRSAWKIRLPGGMGSLRWEAHILQEEEGIELSWHSAPGAAIENTGKINFSDTAGRGTRIDAMISYKAPMGVVGERISRMLTPLFESMVEKDIIRFKHFIENQDIFAEED